MVNDPSQATFDEVVRANQLYRAVYNIMVLISSSLDLQEILSRVVVESANAIGCESARIAVRRNDRWVMTYSYKMPEGIAGDVFTDEELPHAALAMSTRKPVAIDDAFNDDRTNAGFMRRYGIRSALVLPLVEKEDVIGALFFNYHSAPVTFSPSEIEYAEKLAIGAAVALQNARLFQDLKETHEQVEETARLGAALNRIDRTIYSTLDTEEILKKALQEGAAVLGAESAMLFNKVGDRWSVRHVHNLPQSFVGRVYSSDEVKQTAITAVTLEPLAVFDACRDERVNNDFARQLQVRSLVDFPLLDRGKVIGDVVFHYHSSMVELQDHQLDFVRKLQSSLSLAIANAALFEALRMSESRLKEAETIGRFGYFHYGRQNGRSTWSDGLFRLVGRDPAQGELPMDEATLRELFGERSVQPDPPAIMTMVLKEEPVDFNIVVAGETEDMQVLHVQVDSLYDEAGKSLARMGTVQDVTEHKRTLRELERWSLTNERNVAKLEAIIGSMNDGLILAEMDGTIVTYNPTALDLYGFTSFGEVPKDMAGLREVLEINDLEGNPIPADQWPLARALREESFTNLELIIKVKTGREFIGNYSGGSVRDRSGRAINALLTVRDVTEHKKAEEQLRRAHDELEKRVAERTAALLETIEELHRETEERLRTAEELRERDRMLVQQTRLAVLGEMIGNIAHQWRQPLNNIGLIAQELPFYYEMGQFDKDYLAGNVQKIMALVNHMSQTITDFRNFFKPDKAKLPFDLKKVVETSIALAGASFKEENTEVDVDLEENIMIEGYPTEFSQVLLNIFANARDAFKERNVSNPRLVVKLFRKGNDAKLTIGDNAGGIPEEILERIFDPYFTTKKGEKGTGIGLYMSKMIIETNMHGKLSVRNTAEGAEFGIELCCLL